MIIQNGYIRFLNASAGGLDPTTGHPIPSTEAEGRRAIPCQWEAVRMNLLAKVLGEHVVSESYNILIENYTPVKGERIALYGMDNKEVGRFSIIRVEPLPAVCQTRIVV